DPTTLGVNPAYVSSGIFSVTFTSPNPLVDVDAQALLAFNSVSKTLAIAFRGSSSGVDAVNDVLPNYGTEYEIFSQDLLQQVIANAPTVLGATRFLVTGHSLGGAMVEEFLGKSDDSRLVGVSFGSPGATDTENLPGSDPRLINIGHVDLVSSLPSANQ